MFQKWGIGKLHTWKSLLSRVLCSCQQKCILCDSSKQLQVRFFSSPSLVFFSDCHIHIHSTWKCFFVHIGVEQWRVGCWRGAGGRLWCAVDRTALGSVRQRVKPLCAAVWTAAQETCQGDRERLTLSGTETLHPSIFPSFFFFSYTTSSIQGPLIQPLIFLVSIHVWIWKKHFWNLQ